jgi:hypothetical protein
VGGKRSVSVLGIWILAESAGFVGWNDPPTANPTLIQLQKCGWIKAISFRETEVELLDVVTQPLKSHITEGTVWLVQGNGVEGPNVLSLAVDCLGLENLIQPPTG